MEAVCDICHAHFKSTDLCANIYSHSHIFGEDELSPEDFKSLRIGMEEQLDTDLDLDNALLLLESAALVCNRCYTTIYATLCSRIVRESSLCTALTKQEKAFEQRRNRSVPAEALSIMQSIVAENKIVEDLEAQLRITTAQAAQTAHSSHDFCLNSMQPSEAFPSARLAAVTQLQQKEYENKLLQHLETPPITHLLVTNRTDMTINNNCLVLPTEEETLNQVPSEDMHKNNVVLSARGYDAINAGLCDLVLGVSLLYDYAFRHMILPTGGPAGACSTSRTVALLPCLPAPLVLINVHAPVSSIVCEIVIAHVNPLIKTITTAMTNRQNKFNCGLMCVAAHICELAMLHGIKLPHKVRIPLWALNFLGRNTAEKEPIYTPKTLNIIIDREYIRPSSHDSGYINDRKIEFSEKEVSDWNTVITLLMACYETVAAFAQEK